MIYTDLKNLSHYRGLGIHMDKAIDYLTGHSVDELKPGRNEVDGENVFINCFEYETMPEEQAAFEAHELYADIHLVLEGEELIGVTDMGRMTVSETDKETDSVSCSGPVENKLYMEPGKVLIVLPEDAHKVKIAAGSPVHVKKAVVKVSVK